MWSGSDLAATEEGRQERHLMGSVQRPPTDVDGNTHMPVALGSADGLLSRSRYFGGGQSGGLGPQARPVGAADGTTGWAVEEAI